MPHRRECPAVAERCDHVDPCSRDGVKTFFPRANRQAKARACPANVASNAIGSRSRARKSRDRRHDHAHRRNGNITLANPYAILNEAQILVRIGGQATQASRCRAARWAARCARSHSASLPGPAESTKRRPLSLATWGPLRGSNATPSGSGVRRDAPPLSTNRRRAVESKIRPWRARAPESRAQDSDHVTVRKRRTRCHRLSRAAAR